MRVIDFIALGADSLTYVIRDNVSSSIVWRGKRRDFLRELSAFFILYFKIVQWYEVDSVGYVILYI